MMAFLAAARSVRGNASTPQYPIKLILACMNVVVGNEMLVFDAVLSVIATPRFWPEYRSHQDPYSWQPLRQEFAEIAVDGDADRIVDMHR